MIAKSILDNNTTPMKKASEMSDLEFSRWWALMQGLEVIYNHAERYDVDTDNINLNTKKIIDEYVDPISGDILYEIQQARKGNNDGLVRQGIL
jgi:hypothetical protein|tara:strand:- start:24779 stop:25057 length:279 start_codon:yes stop_codon:yes gene_type:complete